MHILALVAQLGHDKVLGLHAVHPRGQVSNGISLMLAGGAVQHHGAGGLGQGEAPQILVSGDHPEGPAGVVQLKAVIRQAGEGGAGKAGVEHQVLPQIGAGLVLDVVAVHIFHVLGVGGGHRHIAGRAVHVGQPFEQTRMVSGHGPQQLAVHLLQGGLAQNHLAAQAGALAQFLVGQLGRHVLVHDGQLVGVHGVEIRGKIHLLQSGHLVAEGVHLEQHRGAQPHQNVSAPHAGHQEHGPALEAAAAHKGDAGHALAAGGGDEAAEFIKGEDQHQRRDEHTVGEGRFGIQGIQVQMVEQGIQAEYHHSGQSGQALPFAQTFHKRSSLPNGRKAVRFIIHVFPKKDTVILYKDRC